MKGVHKARELASIDIEENDVPISNASVFC